MTLTVHDIEFRFVALSLSLNYNIRLFTLLNEIFILDGDGGLWRLVEQPLNAKLEFLLKKNLFDVAIGYCTNYNF